MREECVQCERFKGGVVREPAMFDTVDIYDQYSGGIVGITTHPSILVVAVRDEGCIGRPNCVQKDGPLVPG